MILELLYLAGESSGTPTTIQSGSVAVALTNNGTCIIPDPAKPWLATASPGASLTITWVEENPDSDLYRIHILRNGTFIGSVELGEESSIVSLGEYVVGGSRAPLIDEDWTFAVSVVRKADGAVIQTRSAAVYHAQFGKCNPGDIEA